jgi:transposase
MEITTIGLDLAKNVFQVHAINGSGEVVVRKGAAPGAGAAVF